jgi:uncharacterized OB-fold protein
MSPTTGIEAGRPITEGLFTWPAEDPRLIGSRCRACGEVAFPRRDSCARCTSTDVEERLLGTRGTLWTWTVQAFRPKAPFGLPEDQPFEPYGVGYVELPSETRVEARLTEADPARLRIGMEMELVFIRLWNDGEADVVTYAFAPVEED